MKIWIDARVCSNESLYGDFVCELVREFIAQNSQHEIIVYTTENLKLNPKKFFDTITAKKIFEKENFWLMIFFDSHLPHGYKWEYILLLEWLKEVFFPKSQWLHRKLEIRKLKRAIEGSKTVITLDGQTALELNERLNVVEDKISKIHWFFPEYTHALSSPIDIDVKLQHSLRWEYLIYDSWNELHNNFERILKTLQKLKESWVMLYIMILCDATSKDLDIRSKSLEYNVADQVLFLWEVSKDKESEYYGQSLWVIFSSIYESFPFHFSKALSYNCHIFANDIPANSEVMGETISYLDPLSIYNMRDTITQYAKNPKGTDYSSVQSNFSAKKTSDELWRVLGEEK